MLVASSRGPIGDVVDLAGGHLTRLADGEDTLRQRAAVAFTDRLPRSR